MDLNFSENCLNSTQNRSQGTALPLVTFVLSLTVLILCLQQMLTNYFKREKHQVNLKSINSKLQWATLPRLSLLKAIWICRNKKTIIQTSTRLAESYGPIARMSFLGEELVILNSPALVKQILSSKDLEHSAKPPVMYHNLMDIFENGLIASSGAFWHLQRKVLNKAFTYSALKKYTKIYNKCAKRFLTELNKKFGNDEKVHHQINALIQTTAFEIISNVVMGLDATRFKEDATVMLQSTKMWKDIGSQRLPSGWLLIPVVWKLHPLSRKYNQCILNIENVVKKMIDRYQKNQYMSRTKLNSDLPTTLQEDIMEDSHSFENMMDLMFKSGWSPQVILDEVKTMIFAGFETVSGTMHSLLFMLAFHQDHQAACREEIDRVFENGSLSPNGELILESLSELKYLERCLLETLRIFSVVIVTGRKLQAPLKIDKDLEIPSGANVVVPNLLIQRSAAYFPQPDEFQPDRFLPESCVKRHPYAFIPFSSGSRACIGGKFAILEAKAIVAHVLREFEIYTNDGIDDVPLIPILLLRPERDYYFSMKKRIVKKNL